jgi:hypothetical protein
MPKLIRNITKRYNPSPQAQQAAAEFWVNTLQDLELGELYLFFEGSTLRYLGLLVGYSEVWAPPSFRGEYEIVMELELLVGERNIGIRSMFYSDRQFTNKFHFRKPTEELMEKLYADPDIQW